MSSVLLGLVFPSVTFYKSNQLKDKRQHYSSDLGEFHIYLAILEVISAADLFQPESCFLVAITKMPHAKGVFPGKSVLMDTRVSTAP